MAIRLRDNAIVFGNWNNQGETELQNVEATEAEFGSLLTLPNLTTQTMTTNGNQVDNRTQPTKLGIGIDPASANTGRVTFANVVEEKTKYWINSAAARDYYGHAIESNRLVHQVPTGAKHKFVDGNNTGAPSGSPFRLFDHEPWIVIGSGGGAPAFTNSWTNYDVNWIQAAFMKDAYGMVHAHGMVKSGTLGTGFWTMPVGYRVTSGNQMWPALSDGGISRVEISASSHTFGVSNSGGTGWLGFSVSYRAEA